MLFEATLKVLLPLGSNIETIEGTISSLIRRLLRRMCDASQGDGKHLTMHVSDGCFFSAPCQCYFLFNMSLS